MYIVTTEINLLMQKQTSGDGPNMDRNTGKQTRPLNKPQTVSASNMSKYDLQ